MNGKSDRDKINEVLALLKGNFKPTRELVEHIIQILE